MFDWYVNWKKWEQGKAIIEVVGRILASQVPTIEESTKKAVKDQVVPTKKLVIDILKRGRCRRCRVCPNRRRV